MREGEGDEKEEEVEGKQNKERERERQTQRFIHITIKKSYRHESIIHSDTANLILKTFCL